MDLKFALLADVVSETREGKLNIVGEFNTIFGAQLPITWPLCYLVARVEAPVTAGTEHTIQFQLAAREDTVSVIPRSQEMPFKMVAVRPRFPLRGNAIIRLDNLSFSEEGTYEFKLWVDQRYLGSVPLFVAKVEARPT